MLIDVVKDTMEHIKETVDGLRMEQGRGLGKNMSDLSGEAVWNLVTADGAVLLVKTSLVVKRFAVNLLYQASERRACACACALTRA